uniref:Uncharacterized protein n=1 Tax=Anguilla anguilla TaxID=7936 RepID=A0A0E9S6S7_ANGAN
MPTVPASQALDQESFLLTKSQCDICGLHCWHYLARPFREKTAES